MNLRGLSFEAMPPLAVPFRFFITAPLFILLVGGLWLFASPVELLSRWSGLMLASTHGITLGFMLMIMFGALFQVLPVVTGIAMPAAKGLSRLVHFFLTLGVACLCFGLATMHHIWVGAGALCLFVAVIAFATGLFISFPKMRSAPTSWGIRLAALGLLITIGLGFAFITGWLKPELFPGYRAWTNLHLMWGMVGWTLLLVMAVSFQVIPMFYVTPDYPKWVSHFLPAFIFAQLLLFSLSEIFFAADIAPLVMKGQLIMLTISTSSYALYTIYLLRIRKRKATDVTIWFWNTAMVSFVVAALLFLIMLFYQGVFRQQLELLFAGILLTGFAMALITGMLLKIVPFLVWLNIQQKWIKHPSKKMPLSNMQQVIPIAVARRQYQLFVSMLPGFFVILAGYNALWLIKITALQLCISYGYLFYNLFTAKRLFNRLDATLDIT